MHSVHTKSLNHPQWVSLFQCTQSTQSLSITHSVFPYFNALSSYKVPQSPTVCFLISMQSVHTKSLNHPQWVSLFQCTQFTQSPLITYIEFPYFNALSLHEVPHKQEGREEVCKMLILKLLVQNIKMFIMDPWTCRVGGLWLRIRRGFEIIGPKHQKNLYRGLWLRGGRGDPTKIAKCWYCDYWSKMSKCLKWIHEFRGGVSGLALWEIL